jgi:hypothetical protein
MNIGFSTDTSENRVRVCPWYRNPVESVSERARGGRRHILVDGSEVPLSLVVTGANRPWILDIWKFRVSLYYRKQLVIYSHSHRLGRKKIIKDFS